MTNKQLAYILIASTIMAFVAGFVETINYEASDVLYTLSGYGWIIFGTWLAFKVLND